MSRSRTQAKSIATLASFAALFIAHTSNAFCPSYTPAQTAGGKNCAIEPALGVNLEVPAWNAVFTRVAGGKESWGSDGPDILSMNSGCGKPKPKAAVPTRFPCHVLKAIAMVETGWKQFCVPESPAGSKGAPSRTIVSFDCGYGISQVTSGMHVGETTTFDRGRVAAEPTYNMATGTRILRDKWAATKCVGDNDPTLVEDWYTAIWAYNGLAYSNNPNNPNLDPGRAVFDPKKGGSYTYQEKVLGYMEHPPSAAHWPALAVAYPNRGDVGGAGSPPALPEPSCASPTNCTSTRPTHAPGCGEVVGTSDAGAGVDAAPILPVEVVDAGQPADPVANGGAPSDTANDEAGCSCRALPSSTLHGGSSLALLAFAAFTALARRARKRRTRDASADNSVSTRRVAPR